MYIITETEEIDEKFAHIHTYLRALMDIHQDKKQLANCFVDNYIVSYDYYSVASYAFNLPVSNFIEENEILKDKAIKNHNFFSDIQSTNPIFLYGFVGQGKTTYLKYLINIEWEKAEYEELKKNVYFIYLAYTKDNASCTYIVKDFHVEVTKIIMRITKEHNIDLKNYNVLSDIFEAEKFHYENSCSNHNVETFLQHIYGDLGKEGFNRRLCSWLLQKKNIKICCIVDNIDQHLMFRKQSHDVFIEFMQQIHAFSLQLIIPLRYANKGFQELSFFNSYYSIPINLSLPDFGKVIRKRIFYIKQYFDEKLDKPIWKYEENKHLTTKELFDFYFYIADLIIENNNVKRVIYQLSNNLTREYIKIMLNMFSSRALYFNPFNGIKINYQEIDKRSSRIYRYFIYALMLRENKIHDENDDNVPIVNLFDNLSCNNWNSFIRYHILVFLENFDKIPINDFIERFKQLYEKIDERAIISVLKTFASKDCIAVESKDKIEENYVADIIESKNCYIRISLRGRLHLELIKNIEYYEVLSYSKYIKETGMSFMSRELRAKELNKYLEGLKSEEEHLKVIYHDESQYKDKLIWTNDIYPDINKSFNEVFINNIS